MGSRDFRVLCLGFFLIVVLVFACIMFLSFVHSFALPLTCLMSFTHSFVPSFACSFVREVCTFIHACMQSGNHLVKSVPHSLTQSVILSAQTAAMT